MSPMNMLSMVLMGIVLVSCGPRVENASHTAEAWDENNAPSLMGVTPIAWGRVAAEGSVAGEGKLWSGDGWATYKGGIARRWALETPRNPVYTPITAGQLANLSEAQLASLSPAEKLDVYLGRSQFPLTRQVLGAVAAEQAAGEIPRWHGICHGWAAASASESGPGASATVRLADGRRLSFRQDDLEGLLAYAYADFTRFDWQMIGSRCDAATPERDATGRPIASACRDTNPAALHLALGELIGRHGESLILEMAPAEQIWNFPVKGYKFRYGALRALTTSDRLYGVRAPGTINLLDVRAEISVAESTDVGETRNGTQTVAYEYTLELGANGVIIGGEWRSEERPDFIWRLRSEPRIPDGDPVSLATIRRLRDLSRVANPDPEPDPRPDEPGGGDYPRLEDGSVDARAVLRLVNLVTAWYLENHVGISSASAARLGREARFYRIGEVEQLVSGREMWMLLGFAIENGYRQ